MGYLAAEKWLGEFVYRVDVGLTSVLLTGLAIVAVALLTVNFQTLRAALNNPVTTLRNE